MDITIIGAPVHYGCGHRGVETAPAKLREMGLEATLRRLGHRVRDAGDACIEAACEQDIYRGHPRMKYLGPVESMCRELDAMVAGTLRGGAFPLVIGGDHCDGIGILAGARRVLGPGLAVLWIDSHSDIHSFHTSPSGHIHGVPLGAATGLDCGSLNDFFDEGVIAGQHIFIAGLRSYETEEQEHMLRLGVNSYTVDDFRGRGIAEVFCEIDGKLKASGVTALHVSFDIDSLDPSAGPGTGLNVPGGFSREEALEIVDAAFSTGLVRSMDISELNPLLDEPDGRTCRLAMEIASKIPL